MISVVGRSASLAPALKATSQVVATSVKGNISPVSIKPKSVSSANLFTPTVNNGFMRVSSGIGVGTQVRCAHTDVQVPDFTEYRRKTTMDPKLKSSDTVAPRQSFTYLMSGGVLVTGMYFSKTVVTQFVMSLAPSADVLALSKIEIDINNIPEGKSMTFKWRGKPVFVKHRTAEEISREEAVDLSSLRDPQHDKERVTDPKFLVVIGVCTHLGCVPIADAGDFGGYYCPCHGSHYDGSGRIRKGPAPLNLEVPDHSFPEPGLLVVG